jgi:hypothetical protein
MKRGRKNQSMGDLFIDVGSDNDFDFVHNMTSRDGGQILSIGDDALSPFRSEALDMYKTSTELNGRGCLGSRRQTID